jgi:hypothetical protein
MLQGLECLVNPYEEPGVGKPHARICEGESRKAKLLDHSLFAFWLAINLHRVS